MEGQSKEAGRWDEACRRQLDRHTQSPPGLWTLISSLPEGPADLLVPSVV